MQKNITYPKVTFIDISRAFWRAVRPQKWLLFSLAIVVVLINVVSIAIPLFYKQFFDVISASQDRALLAGQLILIIVYIGGMNGCLWVLYRAHAFLNNSYQAHTMARLRQQAYDYLMHHSYGFFTNNFAGSLVQRVNRFGRAFERLSDRILWDLLSLAVKVITIIVVVLFINRFIALVIGLWALVFVAFNVIFSAWKIKYDLKVAEIDSKTTAYLADTVSNQNTVQLFDRAAYESKGYQEVTNQQARITRFNWDLTAFIEAGQSALGFGVEFIIFYYAIRYWQQGLVTVGFFILLQAYVFSLIDQLWGFTRIVRDVYGAYADAKEMVEIMKLPHEVVDVPGAKDLKVFEGRVQFNHVSFSFNQTRKVLNNIDLVVKPGEKVALIGPSGAGKTTFVRLLLRLYSPSKGVIEIDGQDIVRVTQGSLRRSIAMVPQDPILFHRTLADNIAYGKPGASFASIKRAAKLAHCDEFIKDLPQGLETFVGERGIKLSGGERQRVAIARAMLKNAPILILDEATSSLDSHSEALIQDSLAKLMQDKTVLVIAHRLSTIQKMDRIIVIDEGRIIEEGSHADLLAREDSLYRKLWTLQAGGFLAEDNINE